MPPSAPREKMRLRSRSSGATEYDGGGANPSCLYIQPIAKAGCTLAAGRLQLTARCDQTGVQGQVAVKPQRLELARFATALNIARVPSQKFCIR